jgi:hypothetical protein
MEGGEIKMRGIQVGGFDFLDEIRQEKHLVQRAKTLIMSDLTYEKSANINRLRGIAQVPEKYFRVALEQLKQQGKIEEIEHDIPAGKAIFYRIR